MKIKNIQKYMKTNQERWIWVPLAVLSLFLITFHVETSVPQTTVLRPIVGDEREVITATLDRLGQKGAKLKELVSRISKKVEGSELKISTTSFPVASELVSATDGTLIFHERFFSADSLSQEASLLHLVERTDSHLSFLSAADSDHESFD